MLYLSIETSCDETSLAVVEGDLNANLDFYAYLNSFKVLGSIVSSQIKIHAEYGGVIPEIGARKHAEQIHFLLKMLLQEVKESIKNNTVSNLKHNLDENLSFDSITLDAEDLDLLSQVDKIFVTTEPGLISALRVGMEFAKSMSFYIGERQNKAIEVCSINHLKGHVASSFYNPEIEIKSEVFPHLHLLVSGGNSQIILLNSWNSWQIVGKTLDDAAGECLDKVGRMLGLPYPGGMHVAKISGLFEGNYCNFPVGMKQSADLNYSFSGLKTAVRYHIQDQKIPNFAFEKQLGPDEIKKLMNYRNLDPSEKNQKLDFIYNVCVSARTVVTKQLINKFELGIKKYKPITIGLSGGVSADLLLRQKIEELKVKNRLKNIFIPNLSLTGDNAVMIGLSGILNYYKSS